MEFQKKYGPWALIAGGSEGIGAEFARQLAAKGLALILVARDEPVLEETAQKIRTQYGVEVRAIRQDLAHPNAINTLLHHLEGLDIGLMVYNAAYPLIGSFLKQPWEAHQELLRVNVLGPAALAYRIGLAMRLRKRGGILLMSSMAGNQGTAMVAHYAASKAYAQVLAEGLWEEFQREGLDVLAVCPGPTRTPGWDRSQAKLKGLIVPPIQEPAEVVREALRALGKRPSIITGIWNRLSARAIKLLFSRKQAIRIISQNTRKMYEDQD